MLQGLIEVQNKLKAPKNQRNSFGGYNYRSCEDILESLKPLLLKHNLLLNLNDELVMIGERYYVKAVATVTDGKETVYATAYARESLDRKGQDQSQITGTASSYARKYALNGLFLIDDNKDADTNEYTIEKTKDAPEATGRVYGNKVDFKQIREHLQELNTVEELNEYWKELNLSEKQSAILKPAFTERKVKIGVGV